MQYIHRTIENTVRRAHRTFKVVFLGGPRQVGKTTLLRHLAATHGMRYVTLDDLSLRALAREDPALFLQQYPRPLLIDEVQYAPQLLSVIKKIVDAHDGNGQYWLTGFQQFSLMRNLQESLAGRVAILTLLGFSLREREERAQENAFVPTAHASSFAAPGFRELFARIFEGSFPAFAQEERPDRDLYYNSYLQTYIDRDLTDLFGIAKVTEFNRFITTCAARTSQILNIAELARDADVSPTTAKEWLSILESSHQILLLQPYHANLTSRIMKSPKLHFLDTGLASALLRFPDAVSLGRSMIAGNIFETFIVGEIYKSYLYHGKVAPLFHYRDREQREIDLLIEESDGIHLIECKLSAKVDTHDFKHLRYLNDRHPHVKSMTVISLVEHTLRISDGQYLPYTVI